MYLYTLESVAVLPPLGISRKGSQKMFERRYIILGKLQIYSLYCKSSSNNSKAFKSAFLYLIKDRLLCAIN